MLKELGVSNSVICNIMKRCHTYIHVCGLNIEVPVTCVETQNANVGLGAESPIIVKTTP